MDSRPPASALLVLSLELHIHGPVCAAGAQTPHTQLPLDNGRFFRPERGSGVSLAGHAEPKSNAPRECYVCGGEGLFTNLNFISLAEPESL